MKNRFSLLVALMLNFSGVASPKVFLNYYVFYDQANEPYIETALQFNGGSLKFEIDSLGQPQALVEVTQIFKKGEAIILADKYELQSPIMVDSIVSDFYDTRRFKLKPGKYEFELIVKDLKNEEFVKANYEIIVAPQIKSRVEISDIEFVQNLTKTTTVDNFTKNGYQMIPYFSNYYPPDYNKLVYYLEFYNVDALIDSSEYLAATFQIQKIKTGEFMENFFQYKKLKSNAINPVINVLAIDDLTSGEYNLVIDVINKSNDTLVQKIIPFKRRNDRVFDQVKVVSSDIDMSFSEELKSDSISYFLASLIPISQQHEVEKIFKILEVQDSAYMRQYFYSFWKQTTPENAFRGWRDYKLQVYYAERLFGTQIKKGFESDRGRIHLKYGSPNYVTDQPNGTSAYPYQIWHYYRIGERSNVRFVFYNPDLVTNDFPLIHSDLPGEVQNQNWQQEILKRNNSANGLNQSIRGNSGIFFED
ncbi:MAG: GWxTD domain-containing protein [Crocinitomicaceae bacterium]